MQLIAKKNFRLTTDAGAIFITQVKNNQKKPAKSNKTWMCGGRIHGFF
jgi:hypothetical protein